jgi:hypothetical protein
MIKAKKRNKMRKTMMILGIATFCVATFAAADPAVYEGFDYPEGRCEGQNGGTGWAGPWTDGHNAVKADNLASKLGQTPKSAGGHFVTANPDWAAKRMLKDKLGDKPGTVYVSFLIRNDSGVKEENYFNISFSGGDKPAFGVAQAYFGEKWSLVGVKEVGSQVSSNTTDSVFVVLKVTYGAPGASKVEAFFDPDLAKEPKTSDINADGVDLPVVDRVSIVGKKEFSVDEIRIGDSWAAVCPAK